jgi:hypothetical protein
MGRGVRRGCCFDFQGDIMHFSITITLSKEEKIALIKLAREKRRNARDQAAVIIVRSLQQIGYLPPDKEKKTPPITLEETTDVESTG